MPKRVVIMRSLPGAGKSTYVEKMILPCYKDAVVCSADNFFMKNGEYCFEPEKIGEAHNACFRQFLTAVATDTEVVVVDNTNTNIWEISPYVLAAQTFGYEFKIMKVRGKPDDCAARNKHGVPPLVIGMMAEAMRREPLPPWWPSEEVDVDGFFR